MGKPEYRNYRYTENMEVLVQDRMSSLNSMYCREDYEEALQAVKRAPRDAFKSRKADLEAMCKGHGTLTADALLADASLLKSIDTRQELLDKLLDVIHDIHRKFPTPADYIKRIVHDLAPEYREDTVRVAILKQFVKGAGFHCKEYRINAIEDWAVSTMSDSERTAYEESSEETKVKMLLEKLDDSIFSEKHLKPSLSAVEILNLLVKRMVSCAKELDLRDKDDNKILFSGVELSKQTEKLLYDYCEFIGVDTKEYDDALNLLKEIVSALPDEKSESVELKALVRALETDLILQMRNTLYKDRSGRNCRVIGLYRDNIRDRERAQIRPWELLRLCDELASGNFKMNGATRVNLYHFAIMFKMTVVLKETDSYDSTTNIVKNLFEDFYNDNLARYLDEGFGDARYSSQFEREPTGEGINFKNYVEAIYLYYIYRRDLKLTPGERIDKSVQLIRACVKEATARKKAGTLTTEPYSDYTDIYKELYVSQMVDMNESQLMDFVLSHYLVLPVGSMANGAGILMASEESTAYDSMQQIMMDLDRNHSNVYDVSLVIAANDYGTHIDMTQYIEDAKFESYLPFDWELADLLCKRFEEDGDFVRMINNLNERLSAEFNWMGSRKKKFLINLLRLLCKESSKNLPLKMDTVTEKLKKQDVTVNGAMVLDGLDTLGEMGFDIHRRLDKESGRSLIWLGNRLYDDDALNEAVERASGAFWFDESSVIKKVSEIIGSKLKVNKRISRTRLLAAFTAYYVSLIEEKDEIDSFSGLYKDFKMNVDPILQECRYQTLSEKNILDMYILISLYYYMIRNYLAKNVR